MSGFNPATHTKIGVIVEGDPSDPAVVSPVGSAEALEPDPETSIDSPSGGETLVLETTRGNTWSDGFTSYITATNGGDAPLQNLEFYLSFEGTIEKPVAGHL
ncbi:hypothetical protein QW131_30950 [Roseibium salinum]|nr:hypothetical protein [Roseibium salinum]